MSVSNVWNNSETTEASSGNGEPSLYSHPLYKSSQYIWNFVSPLILLLGNFGNIMTIIIMQRMKPREAVINLYFTALAVIDLVTLDIFFLGLWVGRTFGYYVDNQNQVFCKLYNWTIGSTTIGGWFLVGLTTHRAVSVVWPHRVNLLCTRRLVIGLILGMSAVIAAVYSHYMYGYNLRYFHETGRYKCKMMVGSYLTFVEEVFTYIDLLLYSALPFLCILLANGVLVWKLRATVQDARRRFVEKGSEQAAAREKAASSITWTVLAVSGAYVVLTLPASVYYVSIFLFDPSTSVRDQALSYLVMAITYMLMFCNSAVNFYIYCLTGAKFRREFMKILCPSKYADQ